MINNPGQSFEPATLPQLIKHHSCRKISGRCELCQQAFRKWLQEKYGTLDKLYMVREGVGSRLEKFVEKGGTLVITYFSGIVDENDLCFLNGFPGPLRRVAGIWAEEIDALYDGQENRVIMEDENGLGFTGEYAARELCDLIHAEGAEVLAHYGRDFYKGRPALTLNNYGKGEVYYIASRNEDAFLLDFYRALRKRLNLKRVLEAELPEGVTAQLRSDGSHEYLFIMNFNDSGKEIQIDEKGLYDILKDRELNSTIELEPYGLQILRRKRK